MLGREESHAVLGNRGHRVCQWAAAPKRLAEQTLFSVARVGRASRSG
jgi:hypothetical protein